jgi:hypothetical protein
LPPWISRDGRSTAAGEIYDDIPLGVCPGGEVFDKNDILDELRVALWDWEVRPSRA